MLLLLYWLLFPSVSHISLSVPHPSRHAHKDKGQTTQTHSWKYCGQFRFNYWIMGLENGTERLHMEYTLIQVERVMLFMFFLFLGFSTQPFFFQMLHLMNPSCMFLISTWHLYSQYNLYQPMTGLTYRQPFTLTPLRCNLEPPVNPTPPPPGVGNQITHVAHVVTWRTCKLHAERPLGGVEPRTSCEATPLTTTPRDCVPVNEKQETAALCRVRTPRVKDVEGR